MLTKDQITWQAVSDYREVKRLPSHFIPVLYKKPNKSFQSGLINWVTDSTPSIRKIESCIRAHLNTYYVGRYYIAANPNNNNFPIIGDNLILVAFEEPSEASFFMLQIEFLISGFIQKQTNML